MDVAVFLYGRDAISGEQKIFVTFDLSKVRECLQKAIYFTATIQGCDLWFYFQSDQEF